MKKNKELLKSQKEINELLKLQKKLNELNRKENSFINDIKSEGFKIEDGKVVIDKTQNYYLEMAFVATTTNNINKINLYREFKKIDVDLVNLVNKIKEKFSYKEQEIKLKELAIDLLNTNRYSETENFRNKLKELGYDSNFNIEYLSLPNGRNDYVFDTYFYPQNKKE